MGGDPRGTELPEDRPVGGTPHNRLNLLLSYAAWRHDSWADRLPVLLQPMGIRALAACSARQATRIIQSYPIHIAVVDLSLPLDEGPGAPGGQAESAPAAASLRPSLPALPSSEEAGPRLLDLLLRLQSHPPILVIKRSLNRRDDSREMAAALRAGAFAVLDRPQGTRDLELLLELLRRCLHRHYRGRWPGLS